MMYSSQTLLSQILYIHVLDFYVHAHTVAGSCCYPLLNNICMYNVYNACAVHMYLAVVEVVSKICYVMWFSSAS